MNPNFEKWLKEHHQQAVARYEEISKLDDQEYAVNGTSEYYEQSHQMFGYIAALEKCLKEFSGKSPKSKKS